MAETNVGGISWMVDADVSPAVNSTKQLDMQVDKVEAGFKSMDKQVVKSTGSVNTSVKTMGTNVTKTASAVNGALGNIGRTAGAAGIQIQQLVGQIQGGQSAMVALSQQGADLGIVLGAPLLGAIIGIGASLAGMLIPNLLESSDASEELEKNLESLSKIVINNTNGVNVLSNEYATLAKKSKELAETQLLLAKVQADQVLNQASEAAKDAVLNFDTFFNAVKQGATNGAFDILDETIQRTGESVTELIEESDLYATGLTQLKSAIMQVNDEFGTTTAESEKILRSFAKFQSAGTVESLEGLSSAMLDVASASRGKVTPAFVELTNKIATLAFQSKTAQEQAEFLEKALNGIGVETEETARKTEALISARDRLQNSLAMDVAMLGMTAREMDHYKASLIGADESVHTMIDTIHDHKDALDEQKRKIKETADAQKQANRDAIDEAVAMAAAMDKLKEDSEKEKKQTAKRQEKADDFATGIIRRGEGSPELARLEEERVKLEEYRAEGLISAQTYEDALTQIQQDGADARTAITQNALGTFSGAFDTMADVMADAKGEQSSAYKAMFALSKGFAIAQASLNLVTSISQASTLPWPANLGAMAAAAASGAQLVSQVSSAVYGGRENGGSVLGGKTYEVGEKNKPEMLMIPGNNGKVFSNQEMKSMMVSGGGNGSYQPPVINNYAAGVSVEHSRDSVTKQDVFAIVNAESMNPNSKMRRNFTSGTSVKNQIRGGRS